MNNIVLLYVTFILEWTKITVYITYNVIGSGHMVDYFREWIYKMRGIGEGFLLKSVSYLGLWIV